jgi:hypothetical protein
MVKLMHDLKKKRVLSTNNLAAKTPSIFCGKLTSVPCVLLGSQGCARGAKPNRVIGIDAILVFVSCDRYSLHIHKTYLLETNKYILL